jgi:hypothetical protein
MIGIDENYGLVYEGSIGRAYGVWPRPFITPAHVVESDLDLEKIYPGPNIGRAALIYREDSFDPVTRIRRGRFYSRPDSTPQQWTCEPHPALPSEAKYQSAASPTGWHSKRIYGFNDWRASHLKAHQTRVALGFGDAFTLWRLISVERMITGDDLVTLQARSSFGVITEIDEKKIPETHRKHVVETINKVVDSANRAGSKSIVDRCRDAAQVLIGVRHADEANDKTWIVDELGKQIKRLCESGDFSKRIVVINAASIIARLHARKPNERTARDLRPLVEEDALLALQCLSGLIRELVYSAS